MRKKSTGDNFGWFGITLKSLKSQYSHCTILMLLYTRVSTSPLMHRLPRCRASKLHLGFQVQLVRRCSKAIQRNVMECPNLSSRRGIAGTCCRRMQKIWMIWSQAYLPTCHQLYLASSLLIRVPQALPECSAGIWDISTNGTWPQPWTHPPFLTSKFQYSSLVPRSRRISESVIAPSTASPFPLRPALPPKRWAVRAPATESKVQKDPREDWNIQGYPLVI